MKSLKTYQDRKDITQDVLLQDGDLILLSGWTLSYNHYGALVFDSTGNVVRLNNIVNVTAYAPPTVLKVMYVTQKYPSPWDLGFDFEWVPQEEELLKVCTCGAAHTSFPNFHSTWCDLT